MRTRRLVRSVTAATALLALLGLSGCSQGEEIVRDASTPITTAAAAVGCSDPEAAEITLGSSTAVYDDSEAALEGWLGSQGAKHDLDDVTFRLDVEQVGRVLYQAEGADAPTAAIIVQGRVAGADDESGWAVSSWAKCSETSPGTSAGPSS